MDMITVTFKDDNGQWSEELSLIDIAKLSHSAASKILRFGHSDRVRELEVRLHRLSGILHGDVVYEYSDIEEMRELCDTGKELKQI